ncbi:hypothetical protein [Ehrlichia ruminantium]|nr:hypothetical protein [Ehrlichia ruminantium]
MDGKKISFITIFPVINFREQFFLSLHISLNNILCDVSSITLPI